MEKRFDFTVAGHICLDIIPEIPATGAKSISDIFKPGKLIEVNSVKLSTGGPVSNTGIALTKLGMKVAFMARIGGDQFGEIVEGLLRQQDFISGVHKSEREHTSYTVAIAPPGIDRIFFHHPGANDHFDRHDLDVNIIGQSRIFHLGYPPIMAKCYQNEGDELVEIFAIAKKAGTVISLDMSLPDPDSESGRAPWRKILKRVLPCVDIFIPSIEEIFFMLDPDSYFQLKRQTDNGGDIIDEIPPEIYRRFAEKCLDFGAKMVLFKAAHRGNYLRTRSVDLEKRLAVKLSSWQNRELWCPGFSIDKIASATGAGDSFIAGFLAAFLKGVKAEKALNIANCVGFQNLHELDAISGVRSWDETLALLNSGKLEKNLLPLREHGWQWKDDFGLWIGEMDGTKS
ncbi:MAG TPA: carbohydrate kinase family protein [bacterium]|nr:carbohydrate kinase family protein [bacterium]